MKILLTLFVLFFSSNVIAEIYSCSHELSRFDRPGEVETKTYKRIGKIFKHNRGWEFKIIDETEEVLMLFNYSTEPSPHIFIVIIDKKTKEFTEKLLTIESSKEQEVRPQIYGKCILTLN